MTWKPVGTGTQRVQMIMDSGASCTAMPAKVGEGYPINEDKWTGSKYGLAIEGVQSVDKGSRTINVINSKWTKMPMKHRVVENMKAPLVSAAQTVDYGNIVLMSPEQSFVSPLNSEFGWHLNQAITRLARRFGTHQTMPLYRTKSNVFAFDVWVERPHGAPPDSSLSQAGHAAQAGQPAPKKNNKKDEEKDKEKKKVGIKTEPEINELSDSDASEATKTMNEDSYESGWELQGGQWRQVRKGKKSNSKDQARISDEIHTQPPFTPGFGRLVPNWP